MNEPTTEFYFMRKNENKSNKVNINKGKGIAGSDQLRKSNLYFRPTIV